jgi:2-polyprenyl-3-methyl-5-hydroxy-6-metoxy-1,4-benzoquinol methylase
MKSPLSCSDRCTLLRTVDASAIVRRWEQELGINWQAPHDIAEFQYWRCEDTGLKFYAPEQVAGESELYLQLQRFSWYYMDEKWEFNAALDFLKILSIGSRILEVGVGRGAFLKKAQAAGLQISGMELNPDSARFAREQGFNIIEKDMSALHSEDHTAWDAICAFQVLEHLAQPRRFLDQAVALLRSGGLLVLSVPNSAVSRKLDPECNDLLDQPPHHMSHWDEGVFRSLESFIPLKLTHIAFEPLAPYHVNWFVASWSQRLRTKYGRMAGQLVLNRLSSPMVRMALNLGVRKMVRGHTLMAFFQKT